MHCKPFGCHEILQRERERESTLCDRQEMAWFGHAVFPQVTFKALKQTLRQAISSTTGTTCWCLTHLCVFSLNLFASHCSDSKVYTNGFLEQRWTAFGRDTVPEIGSWSSTADSSLNTGRLYLCVCNTCFHWFVFQGYSFIEYYISNI